MGVKRCKHAASGQAEWAVIIGHKRTGKKRSLCQECLVPFLRSVGEDPAQFVIGYNVYQSMDPTLPQDQWEKLNDRPLPGPSYKQSGLEPGMMYYYYVTSVNAFGRESVPSDVASARAGSSDEDEAESQTFLN